MTQLKKMWHRESLISSFYLFNYGRGYLDFSNLIQELCQEARSRSEAEPGGDPGPLRIIPNRVLERSF